MPPSLRLCNFKCRSSLSNLILNLCIVTTEPRSQKLFQISHNLRCQIRLWILGFFVTPIKIIAFFVVVNHLSRSLRKHTFTSTDAKGLGLWLVKCVSEFQGSSLSNFRVCLFSRFRSHQERIERYVSANILIWQLTTSRLLVVAAYYLLDKEELNAMVTAWSSLKKNQRPWNVFQRRSRNIGNSYNSNYDS